MAERLDVYLVDKGLVESREKGKAMIMAGVVFVYFIRVHIAVKMAKKRNRSTVGWGLFSFFISPICAWILLALLGKYVSPED